MTRRVWAAAFACLSVVFPASFGAQGIASRYPADEGIAHDPAVLFTENFESPDLKKWDEATGHFVVTAERPHLGKGCGQSTMVLEQNHGGDLKKWFLPGRAAVHVRFYVRFSPNYQFPHHFVTLLGSPPKQKWRPFGKAGLKPDGTYFSSGMESWFAFGKNPPPGELHLYSYFMDMKVDPKMNKYWGNSFFSPGPGPGVAASTNRVLPKIDQWQCWEFMLKLNTPGKSDGEQAMWLDGRSVGKFTGIQWRNQEDVLINCLWLQHYGFDPGDPTKAHWQKTGTNPPSQSAYFDDVVVSTSYIGPVQER